MNILTSLFFFIGVLITGLLPFKVLYWLSNLIAFILHRVAKYRLKVIELNLSYCFPSLSSNEKRLIVKRFYLNLADILLEGLKVFSMTRKQIAARHKILNPEVIMPFINEGKSLIGVTGHLANWEWGSLSASIQINTSAVAFYKTIKNPLVDRFVKRSRMKFGTKLASVNGTALAFKDNVAKSTIFLMAADQRPELRRKSQAIKVKFFGRETNFLHGPEKYSREYNLPVFFIDIVRVKRGFYEIKLSPMADNPSELAYGEITQNYAALLEQSIHSNPHCWLWSHRRWRGLK
jgi:Kdo2-lipid IVA lauroyltransferase/acyltransferase